jgi:hypothetical protein
MPRGGARPNSGPKKGAKYRFNRELAERLKATGEVTPLDVMLAMMKDPDLPPEVRVRAAKGAAPYCHKRLPIALEVTGRFEFLSPEEREMRRNSLLEEIRLRRAHQSSQPGPN